MNVTSRKGSRVVKLTVRERRLLESAAGLCNELSDLAAGMIADRASKGAVAIESMLDRLDGKHGGEDDLTAADTEPGKSHIIDDAPAMAADPQLGESMFIRCAECDEVLTAAEVRHKRKICYQCLPLAEKEGAA